MFITFQCAPEEAISVLSVGFSTVCQRWIGENYGTPEQRHAVDMNTFKIEFIHFYDSTPISYNSLPALNNIQGGQNRKLSQLSLPINSQSLILQISFMAELASENEALTLRNRNRNLQRDNSELKELFPRRMLTLTTTGFTHFKSSISTVCMSNSAFTLHSYI